MINRKTALGKYLQIAKLIAQNSRCTRLKVGAIIVLDDRIISSGFNSMPPGFPHTCELVDGSTSPYVVHAEEMAILALNRAGPSAEGADIVVTHSPCVACAKLIVAAGIKNVWYGDEYRCTLSKELFAASKVGLEKIRG